MKTETSFRIRMIREIKEWSIALVAAVIIAMLIQTYIYAQSEVHNVSMQNTLVAGQRLIEDKWTYRFHMPRHGDIVIINEPESEVRLVKRVIALPGDHLDVREGFVYLNGEQVKEPYSKGLTNTGRYSLPITIAQGQLFVMGDNRENSYDSREFGPIAITSIEGRAVFRIWPLAVFGGLE